MRYIISETQEKLLNSSKIPFWIKRRANKENLKKYIVEGLKFPIECDDFDDPIDYVYFVIEFAVDLLINDYEGHSEEDFIDSDAFPDTSDYLNAVCRELYQDILIDLFLKKCSEK